MTGTTFGEALGRLAAENPDLPAVTCADRTISRSELERRSNQLARAWGAMGVRHGDFVSIALPNSPEFLVAAFAAWKLGAVPQPLSDRGTVAELRSILDVVRPAGVVGRECAGHRVLPAAAPDEDVAPLPRVVSPAWKALASGGSTGRPKVIVTETAAVVESVLPYASLVKMPRDHTVLVPGPLHHNAPFLFGVLAVLVGAHLVVQPRFDAEQLLRDATEHRAAWMYAVPTMMQRIWRLPTETRTRYDLSDLQCVVHTAAPCPQWLKREWMSWLGPGRIIEIYSATEGLAATRIDGEEWLRHPGSVGRAVVGEIAVLDDEGRPLPAGEVGHVWLRPGEGTSPGYRYLGAEALALSGGWECFGDLGRLDEDGYLFLTDRDTDMILVGGSNVYPAEIEAALDEHPSVLASCVIGLPHPDLGAAPHAIVQVAGSWPIEDLVPFLRERLSPYKLPRTVEFTVGSLRNDAGKIRRSALRMDRLARVDWRPATL